MIQVNSDTIRCHFTDFPVTTVTNDLMKELNCDIVRSLFMKDG